MTFTVGQGKQEVSALRAKSKGKRQAKEHEEKKKNSSSSQSVERLCKAFAVKKGFIVQQRLTHEKNPSDKSQEDPQAESSMQKNVDRTLSLFEEDFIDDKLNSASKPKIRRNKL